MSSFDSPLTSGPASILDLDLDSYFLNPRGDNEQEVAQLLHQAVTTIVKELSKADQLPPAPTTWKPIESEFIVPAEAGTPEQLLSATKLLIHGSMNPAHPRYLGHMDPLPTTASVIGSIITAAVNNNVLSREMAPIFSDLEQRLTRNLAQMFGLPVGSGGVLQSGGTLCNLQALAVARNAAFSQYNLFKSGIGVLPGRPVLFASELCHNSIQKSAMLLGLGTDSVIPIPVDSNCCMSVPALKQQLAASRSRGELPFAVVATAGTTVTGNIDPLPELGKICNEENLWFHVDASYGGALIFSEAEKARLQGIERADSITFNPQKWCYVTKACAMVLFREEKHLDEHFRVPAPYMNLNEADGAPNLGEWGVQGTRAPEVAKWWLTLLHLGTRNLGTLIDQTYRLSQEFIARIEARPHLELASMPDVNVVCFRDCSGASEEICSERNTHLQQYLMQEAQTFISLPLFRESRWLKAVLLNPYTTHEDLDAIFSAIDRFER